MAKLGCSSCIPLQGMMLLALLLLASIQAGPVIAAGDGQIFKEAGEIFGKAAEAAFDAFCKKPAGWERFCRGGKTGIKVYKYMCKAQGWMEKQNPGGGIGIGNGVVCGWYTQPQVPAAGTATLVPRYGVRMTGIWVGGVPIVLTPTADFLLFTPPDLSTTGGTQPAYTTYTYIESSLYGRLRDAVIQQTNLLNRRAPPSPIITDDNKLCYAAAAPPRLPVITIRLASNNAMPMELGGQVGTVWYGEWPSRICLGILPATTR